jgi:dihydrofolate reductase
MRSLPTTGRKLRRRSRLPACSTASPSTLAAARSLALSPWQGSTLVAGDLAESITALKDRHGEVHVIGSLDLVQSLLRFRLVDRLNLWLYPLLLGSGKQVFADGTGPTALRLTESVTYPSGTLHLAYETAGAPTYGILA